MEQLGGEKKRDRASAARFAATCCSPYQMVKDQRTRYQAGDVNRVLDGDLDEFIKAYLMQKATGKLGRPTRTTRSRDRSLVIPGAKRLKCSPMFSC